MQAPPECSAEILFSNAIGLSRKISPKTLECVIGFDVHTHCLNDIVTNKSLWTGVVAILVAWVSRPTCRFWEP